MFQFRIHAREQEGEIVLLGAQPVQPMTAEDAGRLGHALVEAANGVRAAQAKLHGRPAPPTDMVQHYGPPHVEPDDAAPPSAAPRGPRVARSQARGPQSNTQHSAAAREHSAGTDYTPVDDNSGAV
jgi:hypothetical protein